MSKDFTYRNSNQSCMTFTGRGKVSVEPDVAVVRLGVQTTGLNLAEAQEENARLSQAVLQALRQFNISDITTVQYTIDKLYDYSNGIRIDRGYTVRNILEFRTDQLDQLGFIIDTAVQNGANVVESVSFEVSDQDYYYLEALNLAVENAIDKAKSVSGNLGYPMEPIPICITETSPTPVPIQQRFAGEIALPATPIEPGTMDIVAMVTVEFRNPLSENQSYYYTR